VQERRRRKHPLSDFVSTNEKGAKVVEIEKEMLNLVRSQVRTNNYGIEIEFLGLKKLGFSGKRHAGGV